MSRIKIIGFLSVMFFATVMAQIAMALPYSTYGENNGWTGFRTYEQDGFDMVVSWTVYDIVANPAEFDWAGPVPFPTDDRYIYAYQLFNLAGDDIGYFSVMDLDGNPIAQELMNATCAQWDGSGQDMMPDPNVSRNQGAWEWTPMGGLVSAGSRSSYLVFSSPYAPTKGSFEVKVSSDQGDQPIPEIPEPATIAILGAGSAWLIEKRNKKRR